MMGLAMPASRSLIALLVGTVVFFALWMFALKPGSSNNGSGGASSSQGLGGFKSDIQKAHQAVAISNASNAASGNENAGSSSGGTSASQSTAASTKTTASSPAKLSTGSATKASSSANHKSAKPSTTIQRHSLVSNLKTVESAVSAHKVVALLFYNPQAADDQALKRELAAVPTHKGRVVKLAIPLDQAANFTAVTQQVPVNFSPTLVLVSGSGAATEIVGYSDPFEIDQRVDDALTPSGSAAS